jgi:hypothetical protein
MVADNAPIPTDLRKDAVEIQNSLAWDDQGGESKSNFFMYIFFYYALADSLPLIPPKMKIYLTVFC